MDESEIERSLNVPYGSSSCLHQQSHGSCGSGAVLGGLAEILGVLQLNVCAKRFREHFRRFWLRIPCISHGLFDADDLKAFRAFTEVMTRTIHFFLGPKPTHVGQFWFFHAPSFPQAGELCQPEIQTPVYPGARVSINAQDSGAQEFRGRH